MRINVTKTPAAATAKQVRVCTKGSLKLKHEYRFPLISYFHIFSMETRVELVHHVNLSSLICPLNISILNGPSLIQMTDY